MDRIESYSIGAAVPVRARRLVAVVVTHNRLDDLRITVQRLLSASAKALSAVVVVDNASTDGSAAWLATVGNARLDIVTLPANTGGAGGFAAGIARALQAHRPDWLVVMDDDGRPDVGALETFHSLRPEAQGWDAVAAAVYTPEGEICEMNRPSRNPFWHWRVFVRCVWQLGRRSGFHLTAADYSSAAAQPVDIASFVGLFVSQQAARAVGGPDPRLFLYGDDGLFTLRLAQAGRRLMFHPQVRFEHACTTFVGAQFRQLWKAYYYHRNLMLLYRAAAGWMFWPLLAIVLPRWLLKGHAHPGKRRAFLRVLRHAIWDGLRADITRPHAQVVALSAVEDRQVVPPKQKQTQRHGHQRAQQNIDLA